MISRRCEDGKAGWFKLKFYKSSRHISFFTSSDNFSIFASGVAVLQTSSVLRGRVFAMVLAVVSPPSVDTLSYLCRKSLIWLLQQLSSMHSELFRRQNDSSSVPDALFISMPFFNLIVSFRQKDDDNSSFALPALILNLLTPGTTELLLMIDGFWNSFNSTNFQHKFAGKSAWMFLVNICFDKASLQLTFLRSRNSS